MKKLTADDKYSVLNRDNLTGSIQRLLFEKQKASSRFFFLLFFFFAFLKFRLNCEHFPKRNEPHRWCICQTTYSEKRGYINNWKNPFQKTLPKATSKRVQTLLQSKQYLLYLIYWSLRTQLSWKKSLLHICKIWKLFVKTLTVDDKYSLLNRDTLPEQFQILLSEKQKAVLHIFLHFWNFD